MKKLFSFILALCASYAAFAEGSDFQKGIRIAYEPGFAIDKNYWNYPSQGFSIEFMGAQRISNSKFFVEFGFGTKFTNFKDKALILVESNNVLFEEKLQERTKYFGLYVPLNLAYEIKLDDKFSIKPYTGFFVRSNIITRCKLKEFARDEDNDWEHINTESINLLGNDELGSNKWKLFNIGWQIGASLKYKECSFGVAYKLDINEVSKNIRLNNFAFQFGIGI